VADSVDPPRARLTADELAGRLGLETARVLHLADAGAIDRGADGTFEPGDVHRVRLLNAFETSGVPMDALVAAYRAGHVSFAFYDELHPPPGPVSDHSYGEFTTSLGRAAGLLPRLFAAFGIAEPEPATRLAVAEEALLADLVNAVASTGRPDLALRAIQVSGEGARRATDASLGAFQDALAGHDDEAANASFDDYLERYLRPWARFARLIGPVSGWLAMRHLSRAIDDYSVLQTEGVLEQTGFVAPRDAAPPAVAFVDLTGFTRLAEEQGDRVAAAIAMRLGELAAETVLPHGGHVVKLLGDGVLVRFGDAAEAADGVLELLEAMPRAGLPGGHAGIASGPIVQRNGDVFGRTVNLAARLADVAPDGVLLVPATLAAELPPGRFAARSVGEASLRGVGTMDLAAISRAGGASA